LGEYGNLRRGTLYIQASQTIAGYWLPRHLVAFRRAYLSPRDRLELPSNEAVRAAVEAGLGTTAISSSVAAPSIEAGLLHQVALRLPEREFHVLGHRDRYRSRAAEALLALVTQSVAHTIPASM
jgi:DNA-binding transcriptional LysR family regulator